MKRFLVLSALFLILSSCSNIVDYNEHEEEFSKSSIDESYDNESTQSRSLLIGITHTCKTSGKDKSQNKTHGRERRGKD